MSRTFSTAMKTETRPCPVRFALWLAALLVFLAFSRGQAQVPALVNYQGRLANPDGSPLPTADYTLTFKVFDALTNGVLVWGPQMFDGAVSQGHGARVPVVQGWFNVMLGPVDTNGASLADAFNGTSRYVEVTVSNRPPIAPRQQILTTPFAFQAANAAKLAGYDWSAVFGTNNPVAGTIPFSKLAQREVGTNVGVGGVAMSPPATVSLGNPGNFPGSNVVSLFVTLVTSGRPVMVMISPAAAGANIRSTGTGDTGVGLYFKRNGGVASSGGESYYSIAGSPTLDYRTPLSCYQWLDIPNGGTNTYSVWVYTSNPSQVYLTSVRLVAYEL